MIQVTTPQHVTETVAIHIGSSRHLLPAADRQPHPGVLQVCAAELSTASHAAKSEEQQHAEQHEEKMSSSCGDLQLTSRMQYGHELAKAILSRETDLGRIWNLHPR